MKISKYVINIPINNDSSLLYSSLSNAVIKVSNSSINSNEILVSSADELELLKNMKILESDDETTQMVNLLETRKESDSNLSLWIYFTSNCNLNCSYCYEKNDFSNSCDFNTDMSLETIRNLVLWCSTYVNENHIEELSITLTGGEPLLCSKELNYFMQQLNDNQLILICKFTIISNGYFISNDMMQFILRYVNTIQITLDGPEDVHNARRTTPNNSPTFKAIIINILKILSKKNINMIIRINIDSSNMNHIEQLISTLEKYQLKQYVTINLGDTISTKKTEMCVLEKIISIYDSFVENGYNAVICETTPCPMSSNDWFAVSTNGDIFKCTGLIGNSEYAIGNVSTGISRSRFEYQMNINSWKGCLDCEVVGICVGGCSYRSLFCEDTNKRICRKSYLLEVLRRQIKQLV